MNTMTKSNFCQKAFSWHDYDIEWFDLTGVICLDDDRRAVITLEGATRGEFDSFHVEIMHKKNGKIQAKQFLFRDYLDFSKRLDSRSDFNDGFKVIESVGWKWYIAVPSVTKPLTSAIEKFIGSFQ